MTVVCACCNRIRQANNSWDLPRQFPLEGVISHGYCPTCAKRTKEEWSAEIAAERTAVAG